MTTALPKATANLAETTETATDPTALFTTVRRESRRNEVRRVEYTPFPRVHEDQWARLGFTRDVSPLGMCLVGDSPEPIGSLFRVNVRQLDGQSMGAAIGRVVWRMAVGDGRCWMGLDLLCEIDGGNSRWLPQGSEDREV
jgi:hypothetical protein